MRVLEVMHREDDEIYYDYFTKDEYEMIVNEFFIEGGYDIPKDVSTHTLNELSEKDYKILFTKIGYTVLGFNKYDPEMHTTIKNRIPEKGAKS